jgi:dTDP-4-dehydrorhamnose reductase
VSLGNIPGAALELWGGVECSIVRTREGTRDQVHETGHGNRPGDLDAIAEIGIRRLRYPVLVESVSPHSIDACDWTRHDQRLRRLDELRVAVIAGLVHHGSGPPYTSLIDPLFPAIVARHAGRVAERYPFIRAFTPINEPLTTARFSGLYGHWHPYGQSMATFLRILVAECQATAAAMIAIRQVNPQAQLIQTEDIGKAYGTPPLAAQIKHENERRWLSLDLLTGRVDRDHPWHPIMLAHGIKEAELAAFVDEPCPPDIVGVNYYLTSDRYLDHRVGGYPPERVGGNASQRYADVEATRADVPPEQLGAAVRLREVFERYGLPVAITEVHNGCTREEQLRWLMEVWSDATELRNAGVDVRAVTLWSLFGSVDWNSLLMTRAGQFETGAFDARGKSPRRTILAAAAKALSSKGQYWHPVLQRRGWWRRHEAAAQQRIVPLRRDSHAPILIAGAHGTLGQAFARICRSRGLDHVSLARSEMDIADPSSVSAAIGRHRPWAIVNAAGYVRVADAEREAERCHRENSDGAETVAAAAGRAGVPVITFSSDLVFAGGAKETYAEGDTPSPAGVYAVSKADAERRVLALNAAALIIRTSAFFGPWDRYNFVYHSLRALAAGERVSALAETRVSPTYVPHLVHATLDLLIDGETGIWHLANQGSVSWADFARLAAAHAGLDAGSVIDQRGSPGSTVLISEKGNLMPSLDRGLAEFVRHSEIDWRVTERTRAAAAR